MHDWKNIVRERLVDLRLQAAAEWQLAEEIGQHLEDKYRELLSGGVTEPEAYRQTVAELDSLYPLKASLERSAFIAKHEVAVGDTAKGNWLGDFVRDLRFCFRGMKKNPAFVLFVVLPLALGIGANTAVFTVFNTLIVNPLPVPASRQLAVVTMVGAKDKSNNGATLPISHPDLNDYQAKNETFASLAGYTAPQVVTLQSGGASERMFCELVTGNYFSTLRLNPALGRFFAPNEDSAPGAHPVAVLNYATWQGRFGGEKDIVGKQLTLDNVVLTVVGVASPKFIGINAIFGPDLWIPAAMAQQLFPSEMNGIFANRAKRLFIGVGRLRPSVTRAQADGDIGRIAISLASEYPEADAGHSIAVRPVSDVMFSSSSGTNRPFLFGTAALLAVVGIVLVIACSNVANLFLARSASRQQEIAVRLAIGASRPRLLRQLLAENIIFALLSGFAGMGLGYAAFRALWSKVIPPEVSANMIRPHMDALVLAYALAISVLTGFLFGTAPAIQASRASVVDALKEDSHAAGRSRRKVTFSKALLVGQVALSFLLLVGAALFLRSIGHAYEIDPGFQTRRLAVFLTNPGQAGYSEAETKNFYKEVRERVTNMPAVQSASWASNLPLWGRLAAGVQIEGRQPHSKSDTLTTILNTVDLNYFETAGVPIEQGRTFTEMDGENSTRVAIVNEKMAGDYWPNRNALGKRIQLPGETFMRQIVGISRTANYTSLGEPSQPCVYVPLAQHFFDAMTLYVRSQGAPEQILLPVQRQMRALGPHVLINDVRTGRTIIDNGLFGPKIGVALLSVFGVLALGLASIGLYGAMAYSVAQRKREIGVRIALGAAPDSVMLLILKEGLTLVVSGMVIGFLAALMLGQLLSTMLFGVSASDPISAAAASAVLLIVALLACYFPGRWASRVDPLVALREG
jgi:predicted permease